MEVLETMDVASTTEWMRMLELHLEIWRDELAAAGVKVLETAGFKVFSLVSDESGIIADTVAVIVQPLNAVSNWWSPVHVLNGTDISEVKAMLLGVKFDA